MTDLSQIFRDLDQHFLEYLSSHGITPNSAGLIRCLSPSHPDKNPSMHIIDSGAHNQTAAYCFSCLAHFDILHAAHVLDNKPINGLGFYEDTLPFLTKKFGIPYEPVEITNEERDKYQKRCAVRDAMNVCHSSAFVKNTLKVDHPAIKHLLDRGITEKTIIEFKIGCIDSHEQYLKDMEKLGWTNREWLQRVDLANKGLFNKEGIIIPIIDARNLPVGFVTRTTKLNPNDKGQSKYVNSLNSDIYHKGEILFNFNKFNKDKGPLFIVEGYLDSIFLYQEGLSNASALGSTVLTEQHIQLLMSNSAKQLILCLDADDGGKKGTRLAIERLAAYKLFKIRIMELPEGEDPDTYTRKHGIAEFKNLSQLDSAISPFAWTIKHSTFEDDPLVIAEQAVPTIAAEESAINRMKMIKELAKLTSVAESDLRKEVDSLVNRDSTEYIEDLKGVNQYTQVALSRIRLKDTKQILEDSLSKIRDLEKRHNCEMNTEKEFSAQRAQLRERIESGEFTKGLICKKHTKFAELFDGVPYETCLTMIGGRPGAGKTTLLTDIGMDIVNSNKDAAIFYMSIDDTCDLLSLKMLAQESGMSTSKIKRYASLNDTSKEIINKAWNWYDDLSKTFIVSDASAGKTVDIMQAHIEWFIKAFPHHKRIFFLDNFHKLKPPVYNKGGKKTEAISDLSERVKDMTQIHNLHLVQTVELRKLESSRNRPRIEDLKDTVQMEYDADIVILVHNDMSVNPDTGVAWTGVDEDGNSTQMGYLEVQVCKNKITGKRDRLAYKLDSVNLRITPDKWSTVKACIDKMEKTKKSYGVGSSMF